MAIDKYHLNLAGEFRTCAELLKRGIFATVTFGNMKGCDVVAVGPNRRAAIIEVKTSQSTRFVTGFYQKFKTQDQEHPAFWVLYSMRRGNGDFAERFFILTHQELALAQAARNGCDAQMSYDMRAKLVAQGVDNVLCKDLEQHEGAWDKIVRWCKVAH